MTRYLACTRCGTPHVPRGAWDRLCERCGQTPRDHGSSGPEWRRNRAIVIARDMPGPCGICGQPLTEPIEVDHIRPRHHGGGDNVENLRACHRSCNRSRQARGNSGQPTPPAPSQPRPAAHRPIFVR